MHSTLYRRQALAAALAVIMSPFGGSAGRTATPDRALPPRPSQAFLEELRARTPLAPLIGRTVRLLAVASGRQMRGCCPFHAEEMPSFYVYDDHFHCFGCDAHGDAISFVMQSQGVRFSEAVEQLAAEAGMQVPNPPPTGRPPRI